MRRVRGLLMTVFLSLSSTVPAAAEEDSLADLQEQTIRQAVQRVTPCVVRIETFAGQERVGRVLVGEGPTTGLVVSADGLVVSSAFNFVRQPASVLVTLPGGQRVAAQFVARDHSRMLVLLKISTDQPLAVAEPVPLEEMAVGQCTIAVGRTFDPQVPNISVGILSAKHRIWGKAVQTDAKISPSNYGGPLIDLGGRVLGVLVPLSPDSQQEVAGAEWYDSGIGFAIPLVEIAAQLPRLGKGQDLFPGLLGITLKGADIYAAKAEIAAVQANSPAYEAGLRAGDTIVAADGQPIERHAQLKHVLGPKYAGETVQLVVLRGSERREATLQLTDRLIPYEHPFVGVLPLRAEPAQPPGIRVRYVYSASPAAESGIQAGERIVALDGKPIQDAEAFRVAIANRQPKQKVTLSVAQDEELRQVDLELSTLPSAVPQGLPDARAKRPLANEEKGATAVTEIKIPEEPNACFALVPDTYNARAPHGLVVLLGAPGEFDRQAFVAQWRASCSDQDLIVVAPQPQQAAAWLPTEVDFVRKVIDHMTGRYAIDRTRVVLCGYQAGGAMALLVAFRHRNVVRGLALVDSASPGLRPPDNDPVERLAIYLAWATKSSFLESGRLTARLLSEMKYPVTTREIIGPSRPLDEGERAELLRWIDTLDRI